MKTNNRHTILTGWLLFSVLSGMVIKAHATTTVGATPGSHQVTPSGAFTYSIPIAVPPGTAGIEPKLSLAYNSQGGNGLLGMGWSLSGLSVIHRCPKTVVQDGVHGSVNYDAHDRYCLDGQRLVAINGTYGADATEYRTESESYSRIVSYGSQGTGPAWWKVWTKSGQIIEYGNTADSRIEAQGKAAVMLWALNRLADTVGNYLNVTYIEDNPNGQYYPDRIDYTGNTTANKAPTNSVRFVYETRPDITPMYQAGALMKNTVRLTYVVSYLGASLIKNYRVAYGVGAGNRSFLSSLTECDGGENCLTAMTFDWRRNLEGMLAATGGQLHSGNFGTEAAYSKQAADVNGDGIADLVAIHTGPGGMWGYSAVGRGDGTFLTATGGQLHSGNFGTEAAYSKQAADVNGDGIADLVAIHTGPGGMWEYSSISSAVVLNLVTTLTTGLGGRTTISYKPLTDGTVYTKDRSAVYPYVDLQAPLYVVSSVSTSDGAGGSHVTNYTYAGAKSRHQGGGFLGFRQVTAHDPQARLRSTTTYRQDYPYHGQPLSTQKHTESGVLIGQNLITYTDQLIDPGKSPVWRQSLPTRTVESSYELDGSPISSVTTDTQYDSYGNPTTIVVNSGGGYSKTTTNLYDNIVDPDRWFLGRLRRSTVNSVTP